MLHFAKHDMPILPLHDSFLIRSGYEEPLEQVMQEAFYGNPPIFNGVRL